MKRVRIFSINAGDCFDQAIFLPSGQKMIAAGTSLTPRHVMALRRQGVLEVLLADSLEELAREGLLTKFDGRSLQVGQPADHDVLGAGGSVLIEQGENVESHHLDALNTGGYRPLAAESDQAARLRKDRMAMADALVEQLHQLLPTLALRIAPEEQEIWDFHHPSGSPWPDADALTGLRNQLTERLRDLYAGIEAGLPVHIRDFENIVDTLWPLLLDHRQHFTQLALLSARREDYLPDHAFCVCVLSMAAAAQLVWSEQNIRTAALASLLYDVGMLLVPQRIRVTGDQLSDIDRNKVQRHPVYSLAMLDAVEGVSDIIRLAAYQHHERENGGGYPAGLRGDDISDLTRVLAVADVFAALTSPRHYRKDFLPYVAMEQMIRASAVGQFHKPSTRALVQAAGLFPVGSYVKLTIGQIARVIAANPNHLDRPVIQVFDAAGKPTGPLLDLAVMPVDRIAVERPAPGPNAPPAPAPDTSVAA